MLYNKTGTTLIAMPAGITGEFTVGENVQKIGVGAFENTALSVINFADDCEIMTFGYRAFFGASNITEIKIPSSVISIDYYAFANCINLKKVIFEEESNLSGLYEGAFYGCKNLSDITLPDSIVEISDYCFYGCMSLDKIPVSENAELRGIYSYAFAYTAITEIVLPETLYEIGDYAFMGLKIKSFTIPEELKETILIGFGVLSDCNYIETITLPFIGDTYYNPKYTWLGALFGAGSYEANSTYVPTSLKEVIITEGVTEIGKGAFYGLTNLEKIVVPKSVTMVKEDSFDSVTAYYELNLIVPEGTSVIRSYNQYSSLKGLRSIDLPETVTYIGDMAFVGCSSLTSINIPSSVTFIGEDAFRSCESLKKITIPYGITEIKARTFERCYSLISVDLPSTIEIIGNSAFYNCKNLKEITLPEGLKTIESEAFGWAGLINVEIPSTLEYIGTEAFTYCQQLHTIKNNSDIELVLGSQTNGGIAYYAQILIDKNGNETRLDGAKEFEYITTVDGFRYRKENGKYYLIAYVGDETTVTLPLNINDSDYILESIIGVIDLIIPEGITEISDYAFYQNYSLRSINLSNTVEKIGEYAFGSCTNLVEVNLSSSVKELGRAAFYNCNKLKSFVIPNSVKVIGSSLFAWSSNLKEVTLEEGIEEVAPGMFYACKSLTKVNLPNSLKIIGKEIREINKIKTGKLLLNK